jgi:hypothetical protein
VEQLSALVVVVVTPDPSPGLSEMGGRADRIGCWGSWVTGGGESPLEPAPTPRKDHL